AGLFGRGLNFGLEFTGGSEIRVPGIANTASYDTRAADAVTSVTKTESNLRDSKLGEGTVRVPAEMLGDGSPATTEAVKYALAGWARGRWPTTRSTRSSHLDERPGGAPHGRLRTPTRACIRRRPR
ncbi:hypothetical protein ACWKWA_15515, partial [Dermacoccus abyssi]